MSDHADQEQLNAFAKWLDDIGSELILRMNAIRPVDQWTDVVVKEIMHQLSNEYLMKLFDLNYVPCAAATWITDASPAEEHFRDCKQRRKRQANARRNGKFRRARRSWGRG